MLYSPQAMPTIPAVDMIVPGATSTTEYIYSQSLATALASVSLSLRSRRTTGHGLCRWARHVMDPVPFGGELLLPVKLNKKTSCALDR